MDSSGQILHVITLVNSALSLSGIPPIRIARNKGVLKVLVVDDVATCRKMHVRLIEDHCKACYQASDGLQCLLLVEESLARCDPFDVILLDSEMPNMTGPEASIALRNMGFKGKIIGITGNARDRDIEDFLHAGADKIILKPLKAEAILELMLELKDNRVARWVMTKMARRSSVTSSFSSGIFTNLTSTDSQDHTVAN